jgi:ferritin-like metal-binding protein YciE
MEDQVRDAAIIAAAQRVEHYEMAGYGCARTFAQHLGKNDIADLLQQTLDEEKAADEKLTGIAMQRVNEEAMAGA